MAVGNRDPRDVSTILRVLFFMGFLFPNYKGDNNGDNIGQAVNVESRMKLHNSGLVKSTKPYIPWSNVLRISKSSRSAAMMLERKLETKIEND
jgi:putative endonuclease